MWAILPAIFFFYAVSVTLPMTSYNVREPQPRPRCLCQFGVLMVSIHILYVWKCKPCTAVSVSGQGHRVPVVLCLLHLSVYSLEQPMLGFFVVVVVVAFGILSAHRQT